MYTFGVLYSVVKIHVVYDPLIRRGLGCLKWVTLLESSV